MLITTMPYFFSRIDRLFIFFAIMLEMGVIVDALVWLDAEIAERRNIWVKVTAIKKVIRTNGITVE